MELFEKMEQGCEIVLRLSPLAAKGNPVKALILFLGLRTTTNLHTVVRNAMRGSSFLLAFSNAITSRHRSDQIFQSSIEDSVSGKLGPTCRLKYKKKRLQFIIVLLSPVPRALGLGRWTKARSG